MMTKIEKSRQQRKRRVATKEDMSADRDKVHSVNAIAPRDGFEKRTNAEAPERGPESRTRVFSEQGLVDRSLL